MKYNRLTVIDGSLFVSGKRNRPKVMCRCDCGKITEAWLSDLKTQKKKSCGCLRRETTQSTGKERRTHGMTFTSTYRTWYSMRKRCGTQKRYKDVTYTSRWDVFENFLYDMGERPTNTTLDRIDNSKGYYKENCRWATRRVQTLNRHTTRWFTHNGVTMCLKDWARKIDITVPRLELRLIKRKMTIGQVISEIGNP